MDTVKAVINIGEVTIQLEGPREFVERYLDQYRAIIEKGLSSTSTSRRTSKETEVEKVEKPTPKRTRTVKSKAGPTCAEKILELRSEGYFKEPWARAEVQQYLKEKKGLIYKSNEVAANLKNLFDRGELQRLTEGKTFKYYSNV